jgi:anti-anti-sigma regulatory factor
MAAPGVHLGTLDALARLCLRARRRGRRLRLRNVPLELRELIAFAGLDEVLRVEVGGEPEEGEEPLSVEEEADVGDPGR